MDVKEETWRIRYLQRIVDFTLYLIATDPAMTYEQGWTLCDQAREACERLFPGKGETFDLIYRPRFERALEERFSSQLFF